MEQKKVGFLLQGIKTEQFAILNENLNQKKPVEEATVEDIVQEPVIEKPAKATKKQPAKVVEQKKTIADVIAPVKEASAKPVENSYEHIRRAPTKE